MFHPAPPMLMTCIATVQCENWETDPHTAPRAHPAFTSVTRSHGHTQCYRTWSLWPPHTVYFIKGCLVLKLLSHTHPFPAPTNLFSMSIIMLFYECRINGIMQFISFRDWHFFKFLFFAQPNSLEVCSCLLHMPVVCPFSLLCTLPCCGCASVC